jgi:hypothetical protein
VGLRPLSSETEKRIELLFAPDEREWVRAILREAWSDAPDLWWSAADPERIRFAVLKLSAGNLDLLRSWVNEANIDFRDVLMPAGFGDPESHKRWHPGQKW